MQNGRLKKFGNKYKSSVSMGKPERKENIRKKKTAL
jgi:hypothetical protein